MNLVKEKQGGLVPTGLKRWPIKLIKHFADATGVSPSPAGPAEGRLLYGRKLLNKFISKIIL